MELTRLSNKRFISSLCFTVCAVAQVWTFTKRTSLPYTHQEKYADKAPCDTAVKANETTPYLVIDPFTELEFSASENNHTTAFSSFRCVDGHHVAALEGVEPWKARTCVFKNLFFEPHTNQFHYFASPEELGIYSAEELAEMTSFSRSFILISDMKSARNPKLAKDFRVRLVIHAEEPQRHAVVQHPLDPAFMVYSPSYSFNIGHLIGDDGFTLFQMREAVGMSDRPSIPLFYEKQKDPYFRCSPHFDANNRWSKCRKMMKKAYPTFLGVKTRENGDILRTLDEDPWKTQEKILNVTMFRFPTVIAGEGSMQIVKGLQGIPQLMYRYRSWALRRLAITESQQQQIQPEIVTVILPVGNTHVNQVETMESLVLSLEQRLQNRTDVIAVDMAQLSIREQVLLLLRTKVLVTNQGGGSYVSLFLPRGSTVLLFHHKSGERYDVAFHEIGGQYKLRWIAPTVDPQSVEQAVDFVSYALAQPMTRK
jgi:hypothetical protein